MKNLKVKPSSKQVNFAFYLLFKCSCINCINLTEVPGASLLQTAAFTANDLHV